MPSLIRYNRRRHAAAHTDEYIFNQLIPYLGNKRHLIDLIFKILGTTEVPPTATFLDLFAGSGVVSRFAKTLGYRVLANDWEPYTYAINGCYIGCNKAPEFISLGGYENALETLNSLAPLQDWITDHLCPRNDDEYDISVDRLFYMRKNGMRIDAIRHHIEQWQGDGLINDHEAHCLLAPLLYQACYTSNTSGVFKGFHNGWGGRTQTALYRIASDLTLSPAVFYDNERDNQVFCMDAQLLADKLAGSEIAVVYLDPPYNQHPYGSNYHVLNSITLWDKPELSKQISRSTKSAIRTDWRTERRSSYNYRDTAIGAYSNLIKSLNARYILTSYSTDGTIPLHDLLLANTARGHVQLEMRGYKRYRVSSQRFSKKPMNVEFIVLLDTHRSSDKSAYELADMIFNTERTVNQNHPEKALIATA